MATIRELGIAEAESPLEERLDLGAAWIDGAARAAGCHNAIALVDPAADAIICDVPECDAGGVAEAVQSARDSFESGTWAGQAPAARQHVLHQVATLMRDDAEALAQLDTASTGLLFHQSTLPHVHAAAAWFDFFADVIGVEAPLEFDSLAPARAFVSREPVGVAALFAPWNIPVMGASLKLAAALACGNSCILKPSEQSPLGSWRLMGLLQEAGVPDGVVNLVNGRGHVTGAALAEHPDVDAISFTGGEAAGRAIARAAAQRFARTTMELGGKSANIVFADADLARAVEGSLSAAFSNNGQACLAGSRLLVDRRIADRFLSRFVARVEELRIGAPLDPGSQLGPVSSKRQLDRVLQYVDKAREEGAEILTGGRRVDALSPGYYVKPVVALAPSNALTICQEEVFGPFASVILFDDPEQALSIANDTRYGLAGYIWTQNPTLAQATAARLRAGTILVNTAMQRERAAPFGGYRQSGVGREGGRWSLDFFSEAKTTVFADGERRC